MIASTFINNWSFHYDNSGMKSTLTKTLGNMIAQIFEGMLAIWTTWHCEYHKK